MSKLTSDFWRLRRQWRLCVCSDLQFSGSEKVANTFSICFVSDLCLEDGRVISNHDSSGKFKYACGWEHYLAVSKSNLGEEIISEFPEVHKSLLEVAWNSHWQALRAGRRDIRNLLEKNLHYWVEMGIYLTTNGNPISSQHL